MARKYPRLVHQPSAVVGSPHSGVVLQKMRGDDRFARRRARLSEVFVDRTRTGSRRTRHVVFFMAVAVQHARLAGGDRRFGKVLPDERARHRLRHHLLLGEPHDYGGHRIYGQSAVSRHLHSRARARQAGQKDEQVARQRNRSA